ncbi:hypothetical protein [Streptomyces sp. DSM 40907]|uniref:hypothetical protein n=1 Tax=Streptomyces kutzneri TaxID=3051179 RepID=UPI0034D98747
MGGSVAIEDLDQNVVAYSKVAGVRIDPVRKWGILHRRVPDVPEQRRQYRQVLAADGAVRFPAMGEELPRAAVAIRAGALPLGTLWAIEPEEGSGADAERQLLDAARFAAPHLLRALNLPEASGACGGTRCARFSTVPDRPPTRPRTCSGCAPVRSSAPPPSHRPRRRAPTRRCSPRPSGC